MKVLKFGGTSVKNAENILKVKNIVESNKDAVVVVVSALAGVTNDIIAMAHAAASGEDSYPVILDQIRARHSELVQAIVPPEKQMPVNKTVETLIVELSGFLNAVSLIRELSPRSLDYLLSFGERLSASVIASIINDAVYFDAREIIKTDSRFNAARVDYGLSNELIASQIVENGRNYVIPGFIASSSEGITTTLGRGGSDFSAAILAAAINAPVLEIWTDVDGFMTADPSKVDGAYPIERLSYAEAMELSHFGAKVIYTPTIEPVYKKSIPVLIKNTFNPEAPGTIINGNDQPAGKKIKGISSIDEVALLTLQGSGLVGATGASNRLFGSLATAHVNIILISQASSEFSISFAIAPADVARACEAIRQEFRIELEFNKNMVLNVEEGLSIIAIVGENMRRTPGIAACLFDSLGRNGINIIAIAQGSSELNISVVINRCFLRKALNVIHEGFFLSDVIDLHLFQIGVGTVGGNLLEQIRMQREHLLREHHLRIKVVGLANSRKMIFNPSGIDLDKWKDLLTVSEQPSDLKAYIEKIAGLNYRNSVLVDCTADARVADLYAQAFESYASVVTANKIACSSEYNNYQYLRALALRKGAKFLYETNVMAGLPVIKTLADLRKSGDKIIKIEAVVSGTLNFIFNVLSSDIPLSKAIRMAQEKGYSEPDPRIDLSGVDVLRKLLILSREAGYPLEKQNVEIKTFLPESCLNTASLEEFWEKVQEVDADFEDRRKQLAAQRKRWRYVARLDQGSASIQLVEIAEGHSFYKLEGSDNIILLTTERYYEQPMLIQGAGAGAAVTASGVFADIIRIANV